MIDVFDSDGRFVLTFGLDFLESYYGAHWPSLRQMITRQNSAEKAGEVDGKDCCVFYWQCIYISGENSPRRIVLQLALTFGRC